MELSLNPMSWTPSNLAEAAVETITGSQTAGEIVGTLVAGGTGDVCGAAEHGSEALKGAAQNIGKALVDAGNALQQAAGTAPGSCTPPTDPGGSDNSTGPVGKQPMTDEQVAGQKIDYSNQDIESLIMQILVKLEAKAKGNLKTAAKGMDDADKPTKQQETDFTDAANQLKQLDDLITNMQKKFDDIRGAVIQNLR